MEIKNLNIYEYGSEHNKHSYHSFQNLWIKKYISPLFSVYKKHDILETMGHMFIFNEDIS